MGSDCISSWSLLIFLLFTYQIGDSPRVCSKYSNWYCLLLIWGGTKVNSIAIELLCSRWTTRPQLYQLHVDRTKRIWYLQPMRAAKVQASLRIRAVSPEPSLLAHTSSESRGTFRQKARSLAPLNDWACAVKICHDGMLEDTNSLDGAHVVLSLTSSKASIVETTLWQSWVHRKIQHYNTDMVRYV